MNQVLNANGFVELDEREAMDVDGGSLTLGAAIAIGLFLTGCVIGGAWAFSD